MMSCEAVKESLSAWLDCELGGAAAEQVKAHLEQCPSCHAEEKRFESLEALLKSALESRSPAVTFDAVWSGVERRIQSGVPWYQRLWEFTGFEGSLLRPAWVVSVAAVLLLGVFSLMRYLPEWRARNNFTLVESIDAHGSNVALFREADARTTVIWLFEDLENQDEVSEESSTTNTNF